MLSSAPRQTGHLRRPAIRTLTVCVVDPQADDYQAWESLAQDSGVRLQIVPTAEEALRLARTTPVDLWVINTELSGLSGCELCSMLKAHSPNTPVYLIADQYDASIERAAWQARASVFGCKGTHAVWLEEWLARGRGYAPLQPTTSLATIATGG